MVTNTASGETKQKQPTKGGCNHPSAEIRKTEVGSDPTPQPKPKRKISSEKSLL